jgi:hypothetical protein
LIHIRGAEHLVRFHVVREREGIGLLEPEPLARCNKRESQRQASQDVTGDREAGAGIPFQDGVHDTAPCTAENDEDEEGVDLAG